MQHIINRTYTSHSTLI